MDVPPADPTGPSALAGLLAGTLFSVGLTLFGIPRIGGVHVGVVGLGLNLLVAVSGSSWRLRSRART